MTVQVRSVGRLPVTVSDLSVGPTGGMSLLSAGGWLGVRLPHRLEAYTDELARHLSEIAAPRA